MSDIIREEGAAEAEIKEVTAEIADGERQVVFEEALEAIEAEAQKQKEEKE